MIDEHEISKTDPAFFRYLEAKYLCGRFLDSCGPPRDSYFQMILYFDAFLFCFVSIEEMVSPEEKKGLNQLDIFKFLKAARNVTTHHSILAAPIQKGEFVRGVSRDINENTGGSQPIASARFRVNTENFRKTFSLAAKKWPRNKSGFQAGEKYLNRIEANGGSRVYFEDIMAEGLRAVRKTLGYVAQDSVSNRALEANGGDSVVHEGSEVDEAYMPVA
jgi:hypothetical protein